MGVHHLYRVAEGGEGYEAIPLGAELTDVVRQAAVEFIQANGEEAVALRSCWECNGAHVRLIPATDDFVLNCFGCGRWYFKQTDITIYDEEEAVCDTCGGTERVEWMAEGDPNYYQEVGSDGMVPCPDCAYGKEESNDGQEQVEEHPTEEG